MAYLTIIIVLVAGVFLRITGDALREVINEPAIIHAIELSVFSSVISTILSVLVAIPSGYMLSKYRFPGFFILDTILDLPIVLPPLVMGLCVLIFFNTHIGRFIDRNILEIIYTWRGIILVQFVVGCAYAIRVSKAGFDNMDHRYEDVAMTLGANRWQTFLKVVLPVVRPSLIAGAVITWARIFGLFGPILLVCGTMRNRTEIMPTTIFLEISIGRLEVALVVSACMIIISMTTLIVFKRLGGEKIIW